MASKTKSGQDTKPAAEVTPKTIYRDQVQMDHHLFKGLVAQCIKVDKFGVPNVREIEHVHFFHSVNSTGTPQKHSNDVAGHIHEWTWGVDENGNYFAKCGPALRKVQRPGRGGMTVTKYERIKMRHPDTPPGAHPDDIQWVEDNHTHEMVYLGSDKLDRAKIQSIQQQNHAHTKGMLAKPKEEPTMPDGLSMEAVDPNRGQV